jgi:hypothetical protein
VAPVPRRATCYRSLSIPHCGGFLCPYSRFRVSAHLSCSDLRTYSQAFAVRLPLPPCPFEVQAVPRSRAGMEQTAKRERKNALAAVSK